MYFKGYQKLQISKNINSTKHITLYELDKTYIRNVLNKERYYKVPTKYSENPLESRELFELLVKHQTKDEIRKLVSMLKTLRKRNTLIKPFIQTIALALLKD